MCTRVRVPHTLRMHSGTLYTYTETQTHIKLSRAPCAIQVCTTQRPKGSCLADGCMFVCVNVPPDHCVDSVPTQRRTHRSAPCSVSRDDDVAGAGWSTRSHPGQSQSHGCQLRRGRFDGARIFGTQLPTNGEKLRENYGYNLVIKHKPKQIHNHIVRPYVDLVC